MSTGDIQLKLEELPDQLSKLIVATIADHTVAFLRVESNASSEGSAYLIGSGVLVQAAEFRVILTAHHVMERVEPALLAGRLGILLGPTGQIPNLGRADIFCNKIARGTDERSGPDLALVMLAPGVAGSIAAKKRFYNLNLDQEGQMSATSPAIAEGVWVAQGFLDEKTVESEEDMYKSFFNFSALGRPDHTPKIDEFDYFEFTVSEAGQKNSPLEWGGMSGGGLWQVPLSNVNNELVPGRPKLSGMIFYQWFPGGKQPCSIRCHGRESVRDIAYRAIVNGGY